MESLFVKGAMGGFNAMRLLYNKIVDITSSSIAIGNITGRKGGSVLLKAVSGDINLFGNNTYVKT